MKKTKLKSPVPGNFTFKLVVGTQKEIRRFIQKQNNKREATDYPVYLEDDHAGAVIEWEEPVVVFIKWPRKEFVVHECVHLAMNAFRHIDIREVNESIEELLAYSVGDYFDIIDKQLRKWSKIESKKKKYKRKKRKKKKKAKAQLDPPTFVEWLEKAGFEKSGEGVYWLKSNDYSIEELLSKYAQRLCEIGFSDAEIKAIFVSQSLSISGIFIESERPYTSLTFDQFILENYVTVDSENGDLFSPIEGGVPISRAKAVILYKSKLRNLGLDNDRVRDIVRVQGLEKELELKPVDAKVRYTKTNWHDISELPKKEIASLEEYVEFLGLEWLHCNAYKAAGGKVISKQEVEERYEAYRATIGKPKYYEGKYPSFFEYIHFFNYIPAHPSYYRKKTETSFIQEWELEQRYESYLRNEFKLGEFDIKCVKWGEPKTFVQFWQDRGYHEYHFTNEDKYLYQQTFPPYKRVPFNEVGSEYKSYLDPYQMPQAVLDSLLATVKPGMAVQKLEAK